MRSWLLAIFSVVATIGYGQLAGTWSGTIEVQPEVKLPIVVEVEPNDTGWTAIAKSPLQSRKDIPVQAITYNEGKVFIDLAIVGAEFTGTYDAARRQIAGTFLQGGNSMTLVLTPGMSGALLVNRPQEPKPPFPYRDEEVTVTNTADSLTLAATLTLPDSGGPFPAVILISGSGPQDRDESLQGHRPFMVIADHLTRQGIAVLRFDDRGVGQSTGNFAAATTHDFSRDAEACFNYLRSRKDIRKQRIGLAGHSEGGMIAPLVAARNQQVAFLILLGAPGIPGDQIILTQMEAVGKAEGVPGIEESVQQQARLLDIVKAEPDKQQAAQQLTEFFQELNGSDAPMTVSELKEVRGQVEVLVSDWYRYFILFEPADWLRQVSCPVLALNGEKDLQVLAKENLAGVQAGLKAGGNKVVTIREMEGLNHLFQTAEKGTPSEYGKIEETFAPEALEAISTWLLDYLKANP